MAVPILSRADQQRPPAPAPPRAVNIPQPAERTLSNGLRVIVVQKSGLPLVAAQLLFKTGGEADPADRAGLADMTASLLTKGTTTRTAEDIAREVEAMGATIESGAGWDFSSVNLSALKTNFPQAMSYVADVVRNPTFKEEEISRLREQNIDSIRVALGQPQQVAALVAARVIFGQSAYGHNLGGTPKSLERMTRADITRFHKAYYRPDNAILVVAGDIAPPSVFALAEKQLGRWRRNGPLVPPAERSDAASQPRVVVIDMPEAGQAAVVLTRKGLSRIDPSYQTAQVANAVLGGGYSSRLNQEIRIKRGLSYGAGSSFEFRREAGPFMATTQTKNESAGEVAGIIAEEMSKMNGASVAESELTPRKAVLIGNFGRSLETTSGLVGRIAQLALYGLDLGEINKYVSNVEAVRPGDVQTFAGAHLVGTQASVVIAGDVKKFGETFRQRFPNADVIPIEQLDLDSPTLKK